MLANLIPTQILLVVVGFIDLRLKLSETFEVRLGEEKVKENCED